MLALCDPQVVVRPRQLLEPGHDGIKSELFIPESKTAWLWLEVATKWSLAPVQFRQGPGKLGARTFAFCQVPQNV